MKLPGLLTLSLVILLFSCKKDSFITSADALVTITADSLKYDTVFVTAGSVYQSFSVINKNNQKLKISSVRLAGGVVSPFKLNVDGVPGSQFSNIEINANDSFYVFVQVNVDPSAGNLPFIIRDSIEIKYNGNTKWVQLEAWGRNAHFLRSKVVTADETWNNDLPYIILGSLYIEPGNTLTINKGCRLYIHADAPIIVDGTMQVNGMKDTTERVYFQGDRLDEPYKNFPASWPGIFFRSGSKDNIFNYVVFKNAYQAIGLENPSPNLNPKLVLNECVIDNAYLAGIISINSSIRAINCLISNCGQNIVLAKGGVYDFTHCTVATFANSFINHKDPVLTVTNFADNSSADLTAAFQNCIFWGENGTVDDEVLVLKNGNTAFNVSFDHSLWKVLNPPTNTTINQVINNQPPLFDSIDVSKHFFDFRLKTGSPAINSGVNSTVNFDLDGKPRPVALPDMGCFEKQ